MIERDHESYELFRRAILDRDADAWTAIHERFRPLLASWAWRCAARAYSTEQCTNCADQALARAWVALTPQRFADFSTLARLLSYLRTCVTTTIIDCIREQTARERALSQIHINTVATPEQIVLADLDRAALWSMAIALAANTAERITLVESFVYDLPPRAIHERHRQLFPNVAAVYSTKRNLLQRLQRSSDLQRLRNDLVSI